jgi:acetyl-CoA carboxylase biotin carboxyl carrier protein
LSVNDEVVHGIGSLRRVLRDGDILSVDVVVRYNGWIGDNARTVVVGNPGYAPAAYPPPAYAPAPHTGAPVAAAAAPQDSAPAPADDDANAVIIKSPMVGTFYSKPNPDAKPYVQIGDQVTPDTIVCQIEAMKMFSEIPAGVSGTIKAVLVKNEEAVDVNKPMFKVV